MDNENMMVSLIENVEVDALSATLNKIATFQALLQSSLKKGQDYGDIPGTSKPTLLKPGGEKITMMMGLVPEYDFLKVDEDFEKGFFNYDIRCKLFKNEYKVSEGIGSCNSKETKYRYIWVPSNEVPGHLDKETLKVSERYNRTQYRIENPEICSLANTILKMAKKRAFIDAVLQVASLSEIFTQDIEDMQEFMQQEQVSTMNDGDAENIKITFGKHKGKTLKEIYESDESYIEWLADNAREEVVKKAASMLLNPSNSTNKSEVKKESKNTSTKQNSDTITNNSKSESGDPFKNVVVDPETGEIIEGGEDLPF